MGVMNNKIADDLNVQRDTGDVSSVMKKIETTNQITNIFNFIYNHQSPYSGYFIWDEENKDVIWYNGKDKKNFSFVDIEGDSKIDLKLLDTGLVPKIAEKVNKLKEKIGKKTFSVLQHQNNNNYRNYLSVVYNTFPAELRDKAFDQDEKGDLYLNDYGIQVIRNLWKTVIASYNGRSMDSLRYTLGGSTNFEVMNHISTQDDIKYVFKLIDYLMSPGENRGKKGIFLNRAAALLAFLGGIDLKQVEKDMSGLENSLKAQNIRRDNSQVHVESRFKDVYSAVQKLISQPDNNSFTSDFVGLRFTFADKNLLKDSIEQQCMSIIHYINDINKSDSHYIYHIKKISIVNKGILSEDQEASTISSMNNNTLISNTSPVQKRKPKTKPKIYDRKNISSIVGEDPSQIEDIQSLLSIASSMKTGANGTYEDLKLVVLLDMEDKETGEQKEIGIEVINQIMNNENNKNRANHNFLESQKHTIGRARDKGYNTTQKIYKYITKAVLACSKDLLSLRNKIQNKEILDTMEWYEQQCYYTLHDGTMIDLRSIIDDQSDDNKQKIDRIVHDLLLSWLSEGRICIDNNNGDWKKLKDGLYDTDGSLLHIAFRGHNVINNLETTRLQLNKKNSSNLQYAGNIIFYPFGGANGEKKLESPTQVLWRIVQKQAIADKKKDPKES